MSEQGLGEARLYGRLQAERSLRNRIVSNLRFFFKDPLAIVGVVIILIFSLTAILAPWLAPYPEEGQGSSNMRDRLQSPSSRHLLGTDRQGRDILSRLIYGSRITLRIPFIVIGIALIIGLPVGCIAGYTGGKIDNIIMRFTDFMLSFPILILAIIIVVILGPSLEHTMIALSLSYWPWYVRIVRSQGVSVREEAFVEAARAIGTNNLRIVIRHIIPNVSYVALAKATIDMGEVILAAAGLSFIGLGAQPPTPDWGTMLRIGRTYVTDQWWYSVFPGLAIFLVVIAFNFIGDRVRDLLDPRLRRAIN